MSTDQLTRALRAADPTADHDPVPTTVDVVRAALATAGGSVRTPAPRRRRVRVAAVAVAMIAAVLAVGIPLLDSRSTPTARAAIRLVAFDGLLTPYVLAVPPAGTAAGLFGQQGATTTAYSPPAQSQDGVYVTHSLTPATGDPGASEPHTQAARRTDDGSFVTVSGYGRFATAGFVAAALTTARPAPTASPLHVDLAPSGWRLAAFKDLEPGEGVVTLTPSGDAPGGPDAISVIRYRTTKADFPAGYTDQGATSALSSGDRTGILMQGSESWTLQLRLPDGGSLVLLLPIRMDRGQVQRFADGVTVPGG